MAQLLGYADLDGAHRARRRAAARAGSPTPSARPARRYVSVEADLGELARGLRRPGRAASSARRWRCRSARRSVDVCYSSNVLEHVPDPERMLEEMVRVVRPGGLVFCSYTLWLSPWGGHETSPWHYLGGHCAARRYTAPARAPAQERLRRRSMYAAFAGRVGALGAAPPGRATSCTCCRATTRAGPGGWRRCPACASSRPGTSRWCCAAAERAAPGPSPPFGASAPCPRRDTGGVLRHGTSRGWSRSHELGSSPHAARSPVSTMIAAVLAALLALGTVVGVVSAVNSTARTASPTPSSARRVRHPLTSLPHRRP